MRKNFLFSLFILGLTSIITQMVVLRELTISFYGNEFFIGIILASWLLWVAVGSGILGKAFNRLKNSLTFLISLHFLLGIFLFIEIFLIRFLKGWIGLAGEVPNLITASLLTLLITAPLCLVLGLLWTVATKIFCKPGAEAQTTNQAYFIETLGFIFGGILFSFILVNFQEFLIAAILFLLNLGVGIFLYLQNVKSFAVSLLRATVLVSFLTSILLSYVSPQITKLEKITSSFRFEGQKLIESSNSPYGNIAVTNINDQYNIYESGLLMASSQNIEFSEELIHLSLLQHPSPKKVLLIGGGFSGALNEILKHQPEKIYYLELDQKIIEVSRKYIPQEFIGALTNPKIKIINMDGRSFLKSTEERFDVIICNLPDPSTALVNRFYTEEFFNQAKEKLTAGGTFVTHLTFSPSRPGKSLENLNASIFKTLKEVFPQVIVLPEETNFFLASKNSILANSAMAELASIELNLTYQPEILVRRFKERGIETKFFSPDYLVYRLSNDRVKKSLDLFEENRQTKINKDFKPIAYFYQTLFWLDRFYPKFSNFFETLASCFWLIFTGALIFLTLFLIKKRKGLRKNFPISLVFVTGFSLMALEIIIIFAYQVAVGYLYYRIALLISALMTGMALGVWYGNKAALMTFDRSVKSYNRKRIFFGSLKFHILLTIFCSVLPLAFLSLQKIPSVFLTEIVLLFLAIIAGCLGAAAFPFANQIYLSLQPEPHKKTGIIYAADLAGSCLGALLPTLILIPVFGLFQTLVFIATINFWLTLISVIYFYHTSLKPHK